MGVGQGKRGDLAGVRGENKEYPGRIDHRTGEEGAEAGDRESKEFAK